VNLFGLDYGKDCNWLHEPPDYLNSTIFL